MTAAANATAPTPKANAKNIAHGFRRTMSGRVIKAKMMKTVVVEVVTSSRDALYGKYVRTRRRYKAHDELGTYKVGDEVEIQEHSPISKDKKFIVIKLIKKFIEE